MSNFRPYDPDQLLLLPPALQDWLPADHLLWFISETVDQLDLHAITDKYQNEGPGTLPYHPAMMLKILIYAYATGVFSSRKIAQHIQENIAFRVLAAGHLPGHRTICRFREEHLDAFEGLFVQVVQIACGAGMVKMGTLAVDGSKIQANASKHKAMSYAHLQKEERRLRQEIRALTNLAAGRDAEEDVEFGPDFRGDELPEELRRREDRLATIREAKRRLEKRKRIEAEIKAEREEGDTDDPPKSGGGTRNHPPGKPKPKDQENFTDPDSRIMKTGGRTFNQCYNVGIAVDDHQGLIVARCVEQSAADCRTLLPLLDQAQKNTKQAAGSVLADAGYASEENFKGIEHREVTGYIPLGREGKKAREPAANADAPATKRMHSRMNSKRGRKKYKRRKHIAEPPFGWIKRVLGFRQFSLRGLAKVSGEFDLVCMALNLRRLNNMIRWI